MPATLRHLRKAGLLSVALLLALSNCAQDPYSVTTRPGTDGPFNPWPDGARTEGPRRDGTRDLPADGGRDSDACVPSNEGVETCDELDNDCNGKVDDVDPATLQDDATHCGECDNACARPNAFGRCVSGKCEFDAEKDCAPGFYDINNKADDGCEYQCLVSNGGVEICDDVDNDCDGEVDEDFDKQTDPDHCSKCNNRCIYNNAGGSCEGGVCKMGDCADNFRNNNKKDADGCEYKCPVWPPVAETCSDRDDDCDGLINEGSPGADVACNTGEKGICAEGLTKCENSAITCVRQTTPSAEICDGKDNDCDGTVDNGFDLQVNPLHCGECNLICKVPNAIPKCVAGKCEVDKCTAGFRDRDTNIPGCEYACEVWPLTQEVCDGKDNNCDGQKDEGFDTTNNPLHCGGCNKACSYPNAVAQCENSNCKQGACAPDYWDTDPTKPGCEYYCIKTNGGVETCDNADNDCDGAIDNGIDTTSDVNNCGSCANVCRFDNAAASCVNSKCVMGQCAAGYYDLNATVPGCEYKCTPTASDETAAADLCDGRDNDCDGQVDEDFPTGAACGETRGECKAGTRSCSGGIERCDNATPPQPETCNNKDDDCNGTVDDGFDKDNDPRYCGGCSPCNLPNAISRCTNGVCSVAACVLGYIDLSPTEPGCEYKCTVTGPEICDGIDNDCDDLTDTEDPDLVLLPSNPCVSLGQCAGATASCDEDAKGWVCNYTTVGNVELRTCTSDNDCLNVSCVAGVCPGELATEESRCDGEDNDCDGLADEPFVNKGQACLETGKVGACQGSGTFVCSTDETTTVCDVTSPGASPTNESCNGKDDDCDGLVDESEADAGGPGIVGDIREINHSGMRYYIFRYEASRPGASATELGSFTNRACSTATVLPWTDVTYDQAAAACRAISPTDCGQAGRPPCWRLCNANEWRTACEGSGNNLYPYGNTYGASSCNGKDNDGDGNGSNGNQDNVLPTGAKASCVRDTVYDMSGNVREWTSDRAYDAPGTAPDAYRVRGGSFDTPGPPGTTEASGLDCRNTFALFPQNFGYSNLGFRCCRDFN